MSKPEYPYHPEAWQEIGRLGDAALGGVLPAEGDDFVARTWVQLTYGFACRLERPLSSSGPDTVNTFWFEKDDAGPRRFRSEGNPFILRGLRYPVAHNPRKYGRFVFSKAEGLIEEPSGEQPELYMCTIGGVEDIHDPVQRVSGFEELLKTMLRAATSTRKPMEQPDHHRHLR